MPLAHSPLVRQFSPSWRALAGTHSCGIANTGEVGSPSPHTSLPVQVVSPGTQPTHWPPVQIPVAHPAGTLHAAPIGPGSGAIGGRPVQPLASTTFAPI